MFHREGTCERVRHLSVSTAAASTDCESAAKKGVHRSDVRRWTRTRALTYLSTRRNDMGALMMT